MKIRGIIEAEFLVHMRMDEKNIGKLLNGEVQISSDIAERLEKVFGIPVRFWNQLDANYREKLTKIKAENSID